MEVDQAQKIADETLHRLRVEVPFGSEAVNKAAGLRSIKDKRVYNKVYEDEADGKVISGKWVLKPNKERYVLRGFEEDVKDEDVFASTTMTASVRLLLSLETDHKDEGYTLHTADVKTALLHANMEDGDVVNARPSPEWKPDSLDHSKGAVIWKLQKSLYGLRSAPRRWQDHLENFLKECAFTPNMLDTCLWTHATRRVALSELRRELMMARS